MTKLRLTFLYVILSATVLQAQHTNWNRFRGPNGSGVVTDNAFSMPFDTTRAVWRTETLGHGNSSPVIFDDRLYITAADAGQGLRYVHCLDLATGNQIWSESVKFEQFKSNKRNGFASSTPAVDKQHVYVLWQSPEETSLIAYEHNGDISWQRNLGPFSAGPGAATSPIVDDGVVYLCLDQEKYDSSLLAVDGNTGATIWNTTRETQRTGYSTPCIFPHSKGKQVVFSHSYEGVVGVDTQSGKILWQEIPFGDHSQRAIGSPVTDGKLIAAASGFTTGVKNLTVLSLGSEPTAIKELARLTRNVPHCPTPIILDHHLYLCTDKGILSCVNAQTGDSVWAIRIGGEYYSSPICVNRTIICCDRDGVVRYVPASPAKPAVKTLETELDITATPAIANGMILFRAGKTVVAYK